MSEETQRKALQNQIWSIANEVRGAVDGWDFKQYVLGTLFYRFISENFTDYIEGDDGDFDYASLPDDSPVLDAIKHDTIVTKGYFIYPSQLFKNVVKNADNNANLNTDLDQIFKSIEGSASGYESEQDIKGLFADFDTTSNRLGNSVTEKNRRLAAVLKGVAELDFGDFNYFLEINKASWRTNEKGKPRLIFYDFSRLTVANSLIFIKRCFRKACF